MISRDEVVRAGRSYIGTNFRMYGRDRQGLDCVGLIYRVAIDLGLDPIDFSDYTAQPEPAKMKMMLEKYTSAVPSQVPRNGQILKLRQHIFPMHVGILVVENGRLTVINANNKKKKVVEESWHNWKNAVLEHRELKGVI